MTRSIPSSDADLPFVRRRGTAALVLAVWLGAAGCDRAGGHGVARADVPATSPTTTASNSATSRTDQSTAPTTAKAYFDLALQETVRISDGHDQAAYWNIAITELTAGDIAAAQQILPRIANNQERDLLEGQIALASVRAAASQGNFAEARALNERIDVEDTRRQGEEWITRTEALDLAKKGKADEALRIAQDQDDPTARMNVLCLLVRSFALDKDAPRARKALDQAIKTTNSLDPETRSSAPRYIAEAEATVGDAQAARARASAMTESQLRDMTYGFIAAAQVRIGDAEGASQTMASAGETGGGRAAGYGLCAFTSIIERKDEANARRFLQQAVAAYAAGPDPSALTYIVAAQTRLGDAAGAMALTRDESRPEIRGVAYHTLAFHETLRDGPAAAYALVQGLQSPFDRAYAWTGIARGLTERQKHADGGSPK